MGSFTGQEDGPFAIKGIVFKNYCFWLMINFLSALWYIVVISQVYCVIFQNYSVFSH